jgi:hypothetical protein
LERSISPLSPNNLGSSQIVPYYYSCGGPKHV